MTTQKVTVVLDSASVDGRLFDRGSARVFPSMRLPDPADQLLIEQAPARAAFTGGTPPELQLYPCDLIGPQGDDGPGWSYTVYYDGCPGIPASWSFVLLSTNGGTQRLSSLASTPAPQPGGTWLLVQGTPSDGAAVVWRDGAARWSTAVILDTTFGA